MLTSPGEAAIDVCEGDIMFTTSASLHCNSLLLLLLVCLETVSSEAKCPSKAGNVFFQSIGMLLINRELSLTIHFSFSSSFYSCCRQRTWFLTSLKTFSLKISSWLSVEDNQTYTTIFNLPVKILPTISVYILIQRPANVSEDRMILPIRHMEEEMPRSIITVSFTW